jgi:hypothetical protein
VRVILDNGKMGAFNVAPFLDKGIFKELQDKNHFNQVMTRGRSICWPHDQDF